MPTFAKACFAVAGLFLILSIGIDLIPFREVKDPSPYSRHQGAEPWTIAGIRPGDTVDSAIARLGPPARDNRQGNQRVVSWTSREEVGITATESGEIVDVLGSSLSAGSRDLIHRGLEGEAVEQILGPGKVSRHYSPSGSGVISLGMKETGRTVRYENGGVPFEIGVYEGQVSYTRAQKPGSATK